MVESVEAFYEQKQLLEKVDNLENRERYVLQLRYGLLTVSGERNEIAKNWYFAPMFPVLKKSDSKADPGISG